MRGGVVELGDRIQSSKMRIGGRERERRRKETRRNRRRKKRIDAVG